MKGLLLRLSALDADAESAIRVIGFFDSLVTGKADLNTLLKSTATLAECPVGVDAPGRGLVLRAEPGGAIEVAGPPAVAVGREAGEAAFWIGRRAGQMPLDEILLERFALAGSILLDRTDNALPAVGDPALVELVVSASAGIAERSRALHLLGMHPTAPLRVVAVSGEVVAPLAAPVGEVTAVLWDGTADPQLEGALLGIGPALPAMQAADSWQAARTALRFTAPETPVVRAEDLGGLAVLAERLRPEDFSDSVDVVALDRLAAEPSGEDHLAILRAYCATDSVRKAAALVYRHHSTVAYRLQHAEKVLGFPLDTPAGWFRLSLAVVMRALRG